MRLVICCIVSWEITDSEYTLKYSDGTAWVGGADCFEGNRSVEDTIDSAARATHGRIHSSLRIQFFLNGADIGKLPEYGRFKIVDDRFVPGGDGLLHCLFQRVSRGRGRDLRESPAGLHMDARVDNDELKSGKIQCQGFELFTTPRSKCRLVKYEERTITAQLQRIIEQLVLGNVQLEFFIQHLKRESTVSAATAEACTHGDGFMQVHSNGGQCGEIGLQ